MRIDRILNNNVVIIKDENGEEQVVCGKGIAYKKKAGDLLSEKLINKVFVQYPVYPHLFPFLIHNKNLSARKTSPVSAANRFCSYLFYHLYCLHVNISSAQIFCAK